MISLASLLSKASGQKSTNPTAVEDTALSVNDSPGPVEPGAPAPGGDERRLDRRTFVEFRDIIYNNAGIWLRDGKEALVCARVGKRMRALNIEDYRDYLRLVEGDGTGEELIRMVDCIATNVTSFFRENPHFGRLRDLVAEWHEAGQRRFRFWCSACATGEEPYSMAMTLADLLNGPDVDAKILATDISTAALETCRRGCYREDRMRGVPDEMKSRFFTTGEDRRGIWHEVREGLRERILFKRLNLAVTPFPMKGPLDAVFCRNVMIYFDEEVRMRLLEEIYRLLKNGGILMVGHAESLTGMATEFRMVKPSIYIKP